LDFAPGDILVFGVPPMRVDLINTIDRLMFEQAAPNIVHGLYDTATVQFIGKDDLILNKPSCKRLRDKVDAEELS